MKIAYLLLLFAALCSGEVFQTVTAGDIEARIASYRVEQVGSPDQYGVSVCLSTTDEKVASFRVHVMVRATDGYPQERDTSIRLTNRKGCLIFPLGAVPAARVSQLSVARVYGPQQLESLIQSEPQDAKR